MKLNIEFVSEAPTGVSLHALPVYEGEKVQSPVLNEALLQRPHAKVVEAVVYESGNYRHLIAVRMGPRNGSTRQNREEAGAELFKKAAEAGCSTLVLDLRHRTDEVLDLVTGMQLSGWRFHRYRTARKTSGLERLLVLTDSPAECAAAFARRKALCEGVCYARALTSEPPNVFYPETYAERLRELEALGIGVEILDEKALQEIGMTALLAVGSGSPRPPRVVILTWNGAKDQRAPIAVVGKGVCFDSGGLCIKPTSQQYEMKWDKAGAGVVAGLLKTLALAKAPVHVVGVLGLVENMPDGAAAKPGDVITTMSGQTVEILNTDAEGRLVLADCIWYVQERFAPSALVDLGTMTMETFAALGNVYAGLYSNDPSLTGQLKSAGDATGDWVWELPMGPFFAKQIESDIADIKNVGVEFCGENGAAAEFLKRFVRDIPWAHLDIAGVSWTKEDLPLCPKGVTGFGVRLLAEWVCKIS